MFPFLLSVLLAVDGCKPSYYIAGGKSALPGQFKHQVSLRYRANDYHYCGAAVIGSRTLATAAHCYAIESTIYAYLGTTERLDTSGKHYGVEKFIIHEDYHDTPLFDVAVIILKEDIDFTNPFIDIISLPTSRPCTAQRLTFSGWGYASYPDITWLNDLQWMEMNIISHEDCADMNNLTIADLRGMICTLEGKGVGICSGDSGGPMINDKNELVGIASAAHLCALGLPDIFEDVHYHKTWIASHIV